MTWNNTAINTPFSNIELFEFFSIEVRVLWDPERRSFFAPRLCPFFRTCYISILDVYAFMLLFCLTIRYRYRTLARSANPALSLLMAL